MSGIDLNGAKVLVIGGSAGIGLEVALQASAAGAAVHVAARGADALERLRGRHLRITTHQVDAKDADALEQLLATVGNIDHVAMTVHESAARLGIDTVAGNMKLEAAAEYFNGKFWSQYRVVQAVLPRLSDGGSITLTSGVASRSGMANHSMIGAANAAIEASARQLAKEIAPKRINVVAPGVTATSTYDAMPEEARGNFIRATTAKVPLQRIAQPDEIALAYLFAMGCGYLTGEIIDASGGQLVA
ncbi:SDR family oxidoreductase [Sphingomonas sp. MMS24-J13]|uniref:SDR family oxidoreductase n=1 Tax=Sphingomonas sp. MMS24-J13 TaxID=3238686 RepID=UPI0038511FC1